MAAEAASGGTTAWRWARASVVGTSHAKRDVPCQDASVVCLFADADGESVLLAAVSDGAGSAARSGEGARLACALFAARTEDFFRAEGRVSEMTAAFVADWQGEFRAQIDRRATKADAKPSEYACTFLAAIVGRNVAVFVQIGDGAIVTASQETGKYAPVFWPQQGEYENATRFLTDADSAERITFDRRAETFDEVAIFSDGLQRLALNFPKRAAHGPFFLPMFHPLRDSQADNGTGRVGRLCDALHAFLSSDKINTRTDDDKTLILATRRPSNRPPVM